MVAVSGGVDSAALLHMLVQQLDSGLVGLLDSKMATIPSSHHPTMQLIVAHFDHGVRSGSEQDRIFVSDLADKYGLKFEYAEGELGERASEATARTARYEFLRSVVKKHNARAIVTAHHQDDVLETAIINIIRGTGRKGLNSLSDRSDIRRPWLAVSKNEILAYAKSNKLAWREDSTNTDVKYLRNYVRHRIVPRLNPADRQQLLTIIKASESTNTELDALLVKYLQSTLRRVEFQGMPHSVAKEVLATWLRHQGIAGFDRRALERLVVGAKTGKTGSRLDIMQGLTLQIDKEQLKLNSPRDGKKS